MKTRIQKTLALLLMLAMVLSVIPFGAFADDNTVIDPNATGSIKVTKYATVNKSNSTAPTHEGNATGTQGDEVTDTDYEPLKDAKFMLFKIANADQVMAYYNGTDDTTYSLSLFEYDTDTDTASYNHITIPADCIWEGTTNADGQFTFSPLDVGIYVLKEVTAPEQITVPLADDSLISIPMVNTATSANNNNEAWMYDIYVYPKNHEATGNVKLTKVDQNDEGINNVHFKLSKLDPQDNSWVEVTQTVENNGDPAPLNLFTATADGENGVMTLANLPAGLNGTQYKLEEIYVPSSETTTGSPEGYIINTVPLYFSVNIDNTITWNASGEYANSSSSVISYRDANTEGQPDTQLTIELRNEMPSLTKEVKVNEQDSFDTHAQYRMDEVITYKLTVSVPQIVTEMDTFTITDAPEAGIVDLVDQGCVISSPTATLTSGYSFVADGDGFKLTFTTDEAKSAIAGKEITITYKAKLTDQAVIAGDGNENTASLIYSKYANSNSGETYTITDHARVYTYEYKIQKTLKDAAEGESPAGVEFQLLDSNKSTVIPVVSLNQDEQHQDLGGEYRLALVGETGITTMKTGSDGSLIIQGLKSQDYFLKETKTVANYNLLSEPFPITVDVRESTVWSYAHAKFTATGLDVKEYDKTDYKNKAGEDLSNTTGVSTIINKKGFVLPQTGSMGYLLFCAVGVVLIAGGMMLIFGGRKKKIR